MRVLFAGTAGVRKSVALESLRSAVSVVAPDQRIFTLDNGNGPRIPILEDLIYGPNPVPFLKQAQRTQKQQWREAFSIVCAEFARAQTPNDHHFLGFHLTYHYERIPFCIADFRMLIEWNPDCLITLVDDAYLVRERIHKGRYTSFTLSELVLWRAEEMLLGDLLARVINPNQPPPNFLVSVKHIPQMLARLLFQIKQSKSTSVRLYLSYSIADTRNDKNLRAIINSFRARMQQTNCAAFDPLTMDELPPILLGAADEGSFSYEISNPEHRWPILNPDQTLADHSDVEFPISLPSEELMDARAAIDNQIRYRDFRLIDQAHFMVVYRPTLSPGPDGKPSSKLGSGVQAEVDYAAATGCPTVWFIKKNEDPLPTSPFVPKSAGDDPNFFYDENEEGFWQRIKMLHKEKNTSRDTFLR